MMVCFLRSSSIILLLSLVNVNHGQAQSTTSLATPFDGPNGDAYADGDKFSIITGSTAVSIERLDIHMAAVTEHVEVWTKDGYPNWWNDNTWTKIWEGTIVGQGQGVATPLPAFSSPIELRANSVLGVYALVDNYSMNEMYHSTGVLGQNEVFLSDDYISIAEGISAWHMHANFQQPTRWNGVVYYSIAGPVPSMSPTLSAVPSYLPSVEPSSNPSLSSQPSVSPSLTPSSIPSLVPTESNFPTPSDPNKSPSSAVCQYVSIFYAVWFYVYLMRTIFSPIVSMCSGHL